MVKTYQEVITVKAIQKNLNKFSELLFKNILTLFEQLFIILTYRRTNVYMALSSRSYIESSGDNYEDP